MAALKLTITAEEFAGLDEGVQGLYTELDDGGGYRLELDTSPDAELKGRIDQFRSRNVKLLAQVEKLSSKLEAAQAAGDKTAEQIEAEKNTVEARLARMEKKFQDAQAAAEASRLEVQQERFQRTVRKVAAKAGISSTAMDDAVLHLQTRRKMELGEDGVTAPDGTTIDEALQVMRKETPYFFGGSRGSGADPGPGRKAPRAGEVTSVLGNEEAIISGKAKLAGSKDE